MSDDAGTLEARLGPLGRDLGGREAEHAASLEQATRCAEHLHARVGAGLDAFHAAATEAGAAHLKVLLSGPRLDDKHLRSVQFDLTRGRHRAIVTVKSRGEVTLVGPFKRGKNEGPCKTFAIEDEASIESALGDFLVALIEEAATP